MRWRADVRLSGSHEEAHESALSWTGARTGRDSEQKAEQAGAKPFLILRCKGINAVKGGMPQAELALHVGVLYSLAPTRSRRVLQSGSRDCFASTTLTSPLSTSNSHISHGASRVFQRCCQQWRQGQHKWRTLQLRAPLVGSPLVLNAYMSNHCLGSRSTALFFLTTLSATPKPSNA